MNMNQTFFHKYELPLFFILTNLLSWWTVPFMNGGLFPNWPVLAAMIVIALTSDSQGLREILGWFMNFHAGWWYVVGVHWFGKDQVLHPIHHLRPSRRAGDFLEIQAQTGTGRRHRKFTIA